MKNIVKVAIFLGIVCVICAAVLSYTNGITAPIVAKNEKEKIDGMLKEMVPDATKFEEVPLEKNKNFKNMYVAYKDDKKVMDILQVSANGFQSEVKVLVAINPEGKYDGFKVIAQAETPGYGDVIILDKDYINQYYSKAITDELDTVSGSTVTTKALKDAIDAALVIYQEQNNK